MKYIIMILAAVALIVGCSSSTKYSQTKSHTFDRAALVGSWHSNGKRYNRGNLQIQEIRKEQFFQNGQLLSSKWFRFKDRVGRDLGGYYITKLFTWKRKGNRVIAKFNRCSVGVVNELKASNLGYSQLKRKCEHSLRFRGKTTVKRLKFITNRDISLGGVSYHKE